MDGRPRTRSLALPGLGLAALIALAQACDEGGALPDSGQPALRCPELSIAYLFDPDAAAGARAGLEAAGFVVEPLPATAPDELRGLIVFASDAAARPAYADYMARHAAELRAFVERGNLLLQLPQSAALEPTPPFVSRARRVRRIELAVTAARVVNAGNPLLRDAASAGGFLLARSPGLNVNAFSAYAGYEVLLSDDSGTYPLLLEGQYGAGRMLLSAVAFDRPGQDPEAAALGQLFFANLRDHLDSVCAQTAPPLQLGTVTERAFEPGSRLLAVLPDTQVYSWQYPELFEAQTSFIRNNAARLGIDFVVNLGDIVQSNIAPEWVKARAAMAALDDAVPYAIIPGNHDYGPDGSASTRDTLLNDYFEYDQLSAFPTFGGAYEAGRLDNTYHLFSIGSRNFVLIALEWGPRDAVVAWADQVMREHPDRDGVLITHAYLNNDDLRYDHTDTGRPQEYNPHDYATPGGVNDGEELWQKLVRHHRFVMVLNGHVLGDGIGYLASATDKGNVCHQMLSNYQFRQLGGEGYLRLLEFLADGRTVNVFTYSPRYDAFLDEPEQNFTIVLDGPM